MEIGRAMLEELISRYKMFDITDPRYDGFGGWPNSRVRWAEAKGDFIRAVGKLFVEDAANSF